MITMNVTVNDVLRTEAEVRAAYHRLAERFGGRQRRVLVQPMIAGGTELIAG